MTFTTAESFESLQVDGTTTRMETANYPGVATLDGTFTDVLNNKTSPEFTQIQEDFCSKVCRT